MRFSRTRRVFGHHQHLVEERVHRRLERGERLQRRRCSRRRGTQRSTAELQRMRSALDQRASPPAPLNSVRVEARLALRRRPASGCWRCACSPRPGSRASGSGDEGAHRRRAAGTWSQRAPRIAAEHRFDLRRRVAALAQVAAQAFQHESRQSTARRPDRPCGSTRDRRARPARAAPTANARSTRMRITPSACAAQRERILLAGRLLTDAEHAGERHRACRPAPRRRPPCPAGSRSPAKRGR